MIASNGHAPKAFRRNAQPHIYVCSKGFRGAAPDKQRAVFAAAEIARKAKWVPLCPACQNCVYEKVYYKLLLLANPLFYGNRKIFVISIFSYNYSLRVAMNCLAIAFAILAAVFGKTKKKITIIRILLSAAIIIFILVFGMENNAIS